MDKIIFTFNINVARSYIEIHRSFISTSRILLHFFVDTKKFKKFLFIHQRSIDTTIAKPFSLC